MDHARTIAMAKDLLADGRADDVVQMIDPLLDSVDAPAANTGQLLLRALRAQVDVAYRYAPTQTLDRLPSRTQVADLCTCVRADVSLWRGWAHVLRNRDPGEAAQGLRLLKDAHELHGAIHDPSGRCWSVLGQALAYFTLDEYSLLRHTLDEAASLVHSLDDVQAKGWLYELRLPALQSAGSLEMAQRHVDALRTFGEENGDLRRQAVADAYEALLVIREGSGTREVTERAETATAALRRTDGRMVYPLLAAYRARLEAFVEENECNAARDVVDQADRDLPGDPVAQAASALLRGRWALHFGDLTRADSILSPLVRTTSPLPRGLPRSEIRRLYGRLLSRQERLDAASAWLASAHRNASESGHHTEKRRTLRILARTTLGTASCTDPPPASLKRNVSERSVGAVHGIVAESEAVQEVLDEVRSAQPSHSPVLITGERGTGKRRWARIVHDTSTRSEGPLEYVAAADMQHQPTEERLFGSVDGSGHRSPGAVHAANGGTLVIEDVDALSLAAQSSLLELLTTGHVAPDGSTEMTAVDVRIIATTTEDLEERIRNGHFRPALRDWLRIVSFEVPPLRERRADIPLLVRQFLDELRPAGSDATVTQPAMEALLRYEWPGNGRQLRNEIERALVYMSSEPAPTIDTDVLLDTIVEHAQTTGPGSATEDPDVILNPNQTLSDVLSRTEKDVIERVLRACDGQVTASAEVLGLTRQGLYKKMKRLGIDASSFEPAADPVGTSS